MIDLNEFNTLVTKLCPRDCDRINNLVIGYRTNDSESSTFVLFEGKTMKGTDTRDYIKVAIDALEGSGATVDYATFETEHVRITEIATGDVDGDFNITGYDTRRAQKLIDGIMINMDHENWKIEQVTESHRVDFHA